MKISLNELQSVCRKAFAGMGFAAGHADDAAAMVASSPAQLASALDDPEPFVAMRARAACKATAG